MISKLHPIRGNGVYLLLKGQQQLDNCVCLRFRLFLFREFFHQQKACLSLGQCYYGFLPFNSVYLPVSKARTGIHYRRSFIDTRFLMLRYPSFGCFPCLTGDGGAYTSCRLLPCSCGYWLYRSLDGLPDELG